MTSAAPPTVHLLVALASLELLLPSKQLLPRARTPFPQLIFQLRSPSNSSQPSSLHPFLSGCFYHPQSQSTTQTANSNPSLHSTMSDTQEDNMTAETGQPTTEISHTGPSTNRDEAAAKAREHGWKEPTAFDYAAYGYGTTTDQQEDAPTTEAGPSFQWYHEAPKVSDRRGSKYGSSTDFTSMIGWAQTLLTTPRTSVLLTRSWRVSSFAANFITFREICSKISSSLKSPLSVLNLVAALSPSRALPTCRFIGS